MSAYTPKVGDTVRATHWADESKSVVVSAVGRSRLLAVHPIFGEDMYDLAIPWVRVESTPLDRWLVFNDAHRIVDGPFASPFYALQLAEANPGARVARFSFAEWVEASS